jgi:hypothetical protein
VIKDGMALGLGSDSTSAFAIEALAARSAAGLSELEIELLRQQIGLLRDLRGGSTEARAPHRTEINN